MQKLPKLHPQTWARDLVDPKFCTEKSAAIFLCGMWSLWMARNRRRHDDPELPVKIAVDWAVDTAYDLWQLEHPITQKMTPREKQHWRRPPPGWIKCNIDASFVGEEGRGATGVVLRDEAGAMLWWPSTVV